MNILAIDWQQGWELAGWTMCYFLVGGTLVALVASAARYALRHTAPHIRYSISLAGFAALALLPLGIATWLMPTATGPQPSFSAIPSTAVARDNTPVPDRPNMPVLKPPYASQEYATTTIPLSAERFAVESPQRWWAHAVDWLPWLWIVGAPLTFTLLATGLVGSRRLRHASQPLDEGHLFDACAGLRASLGVSRRVGVALCERIASPLLVGIVRPLILLPPAALGGWSPEQLEMVLLHELAHVRRWDNLVNLVQRLVESLLFFHPAVWLLSRQVRRDREECCDAVVVAHTAKPQAYAELLVSFATPAQPLAGLALARHPLALRIRRILKLEDETMLVSRSTMGLATLALIALVAALLWQPSAETLAEETESRVVDDAGEGVAASRVPFSVSLDIVRQQRVFSDPPAAKMWKETQLALIKSPVILESEPVKTAIQALPVARDQRDPSAWLRRRLQVTMTPMAIHLELAGPAGQSLQMLHVLQAVMRRYAEETNAQRDSPFPTLEAQRAADVAYKMLGIELEQLDKEELARVKAMKFAGGLRVGSTSTGPFGEGFGGGGFGGSRPKPLQPGDLLVGLHVWPTESLEQVREVLNRDDLAELSPLKFYVVRREARGANPGLGARGREADMVDKLVTGRIAVDAAAVKQSESSDAYPTAPTTFQSDKSATRQLYDGKTFGQWRSQWKNELSIKHRTETVRAMAAFGNTGHGKEAAEVILEIAGQYDWNSLGDGLIKQLQSTCINAFGKKSIFGERAFGSFPNTLPRQVAKEALSTAMHSENVRVRAFVEYVLPNFESLIEIFQEQWEKDEELKKYWGPKRTVAPGFGLGGGGRSTPPQ